MSKQYMLFVDEQQLDFLRRGMENAFDRAVKEGTKEQILAVSGLVHQLQHPIERRQRSTGWLDTVKKQLGG